MPRLCLNGIVKNESMRIERMLNSVHPFITSLVMVDTGSTDGTPDIIERWAAQRALPYLIDHAPFEDWSQARNAALRAVRGSHLPYDYLLLVDADMELVVNNPHAFDALTGPGWDMFQKQGDLTYLNRRLVHACEHGEYKGVTHEYLDCPAGGQISFQDAYFQDYADGANRPDKAKRDIALLKRGLKAEPNNARYFFYLAQSYKDAGAYDKAIQWYRRRASLDDFPEEAWYAQYQLAWCYRALNRDAEFVYEMNKAHAQRPWRAEPLYALARYYREIDKHQALGVLYAEAAMALPFPKDDVLFVENYAHGIGPREEFGICGFYLPAKKAKAFEALDSVALDGRPEVKGAREGARVNLYHYLPTLKQLCPSFTTKTIGGLPDVEGYVAMNPSVAKSSLNSLWSVVRYVNYCMDDDGRYLIRGTDGESNQTNPIHTRNFLVQLNRDLDAVTSKELLPAGNLPVEFPLVIGFEDMRLFWHNGQFHTSSTVRQLTKEGYCEQVISAIGDGKISDLRRMPRKATMEKNWMPQVWHEWTGDFLYRLNMRIDAGGSLEKLFETSVDVDGISGSSQVIRDGNFGWIAIVHEARPRLDKPWKRYYWHRVVRWDDAFSYMQISRPFVFEDRTIEFCAGLALSTDGKRFVISYGFEDRLPRIATVNYGELLGLPQGVP